MTGDRERLDRGSCRRVARTCTYFNVRRAARVLGETYDRALRIRALARELPLTAIVLETDAPDIVTAAHRGERNSPEYLPEVLAVLAELRDEDAATIAARTSANARAVLRMWPVTTV